MAYSTPSLSHTHELSLPDPAAVPHVVAARSKLSCYCLHCQRGPMGQEAARSWHGPVQHFKAEQPPLSPRPSVIYEDTTALQMRALVGGATGDSQH